jgi:hypothetical protein
MQIAELLNIRRLDDNTSPGDPGFPRAAALTASLATGFRAPNGVCVNPDGTFYLTDQEGFWLTKNRINLAERGGCYGNFWGATGVKDPSDAAMKQPVCWITNAFDRSPSEMLWVTGDGWGPLKGALLNFSYGYGSAGYGSKHHDEKPSAVTGVTVSGDGKAVTLHLAGMKPTWCMEIRYTVKGGRRQRGGGRDPQHRPPAGGVRGHSGSPSWRRRHIRDDRHRAPRAAPPWGRSGRRAAGRESICMV